MKDDRKHIVCALGKSIKIKLLELNKTQNWLISELQSHLPNMYIDSSVLFKILTGDIKSGKVLETAKEILEITEDNT